MPGSFAARLRSYRRRAGLTAYALAQRAHITGGYVTRLEDGSREPGRQVVDTLVAALALSGRETVEFYFLAGFVPAAWLPLATDDTLLRVIAVLTDPSIDPVARGTFRAAVTTMAGEMGREEGER